MSVTLCELTERGRPKMLPRFMAMHRGGWLWGCVLALGAAAGCKRAPSAPPSGQPWPLPFDGCALVQPGPVCALPADRSVRVFVAESTDAASVHVQDSTGTLRLPAPDATTGGSRFTLVAPAGATWISVQAPGADGAPRVFILRLAADPWPDGLSRARTLQEAHEAAGARAALAHVAPSLAPPLQARARGIEARLALWEGHTDAAIAGLSQSSQRLLDAGRVSDAIHDTFALVYALLARAHQLGEARARLEKIAAHLAADPGARGEWHLYEGQIAAAVGDQRSALHAFAQSSLLAGQLGQSRVQRYARYERSRVLFALGRIDEAHALAKDVVQSLVADAAARAAERPCVRVLMRHNLLWIALSHWLREGRRSGGAEVKALLADAEADAPACPDPTQSRHLRTAFALFALESGDLTSARTHLDALAASADGREPTLSIWEVELSARLALADKAPARALALYTRQRGLAETLTAPESVYRATLGQGRAFAALGRPLSAVAQFRAAEALLDDQLAAVPVGEGRDVFLAEREDSARELVSTLVALGRAAEAMDVARLARARLLRATAVSERLAELPPAAHARWLEAISDYRRKRAALEADAQDDWRLAAEQLETARASRRQRELAVRAALDDAYRVLRDSTPELAVSADAAQLRRPRPGELFLAFVPDTNGWLGFADDGVRVQAARVGTPGDFSAPAPPLVAIAAPVRDGSQAPAAAPDAAAAPITHADRFLAPFDVALARAQRVRLFPHAALESIDFHALPWRGQPLGSTHAVEYGLDVGRRSAAPVLGARALAAFLVADPSLDLPAAREEVAGLRAQLGARAAAVVEGRAATRARILEELPRHTVFHYAGHGSFGGLEGMDSALVAADRARIRVGDVLVLPRVPDLVVLSACDAGRSRGTAGTGALGLAQAFLAAGSGAVVASVRPVADRGASALMNDFYGELVRQPSLDPAVALKQAAGDLRKHAPAFDWTSFRVLVP